MARWASPASSHLALRDTEPFQVRELRERGQGIVIDQRLRKEQFLEVLQAGKLLQAVATDPEKIETQDLQACQPGQVRHALVVDGCFAVFSGKSQHPQVAGGGQFFQSRIGDLAFLQFRGLERRQLAEDRQGRIGDAGFAEPDGSDPLEALQGFQGAVIDLRAAEADFHDAAFGVFFEFGSRFL